jgi:capsular exopolysaccharide synthesis family protein
MQHDVETEVEAPGWDTPPASRNFLYVLWQRKAFILLGAFVGLALGFLFHTQRAAVYQSSCQLLVIKKSPSVLPAGNDPRMTMVDDYMPAQLALLRSPLILERAVKKRDLAACRTFETVADPTGAILAGLGVSRDTKETGGVPNNIVLLSYRGPVADDTGKVLSAVVDSYQEWLDITYRNVSDQTVKEITTARDLIKRDLTEAEDKYLKFRQNSPTFWKNEKGVSVETQRVADGEQKRLQMQLKQTELRERIRALERAIEEGKGLDVLSAAQGVGPDGKQQQLVADRYVEEPLLPLILEEQKLVDDRGFGPDHPEVIAVRKKIATMREHLRKIAPQPSERDPAKRLLLVLRFEQETLDLEVRALEQMLARMRTEARNLSNHEIEDNHLRNDVARLESLYSETIKRLSQINLVRDSGGIQAQPLSTPGPGGKVAPVAYQDLGAGLLLGLLLGVGLAYLSDLADKSFRDSEEIRRRLGLPLVGHIPYITADADTERRRKAGEATLDPLLCTYFRPKSIDAEAYRAVRTALFFGTHGRGHQVIQVTSPNKGDGKSLMIANLAVTVAQSGKRVLLIDADCRRPRQHRVFNLPATTGLASVLGDRGDVDAALESTVVETAVPGLSMLPCGPIPSNPSELLTAPRFKEVLEAVRARYDYVLVDTPPLLAVTDPCVVAGRVDGLFLTIRLTRRGRPDAERAREILSGLGAKVFGVVVNGVTRSGGGLYSPHAYDYTDTYTEDPSEAPEDSYYYEEEAEEPTGVRSESGGAEHDGDRDRGARPAAGKNTRGFWRRWWPSGG